MIQGHIAFDVEGFLGVVDAFLSLQCGWVFLSCPERWAGLVCFAPLIDLGRMRFCPRF